MPQYFPLIDPSNEFFGYTIPINEDSMMIACAYNSTYNKVTKDITFMFTSIHIDLWIATLLCFLCFVSMLQLGHWLLGSNHKSPLWMVTSAFLYEDNIPQDSLFHKLLNACVAFFLFFFGSYLLNSMSSDLVVYTNPPVITSYGDIIDRIQAGNKLDVIMPPQLPETARFASAPPGSWEEKMFALRSTMLDSDHVSVPMMLAQLTGPIVNLEAVVIMREFVMRPVAAYALSVSGSLEQFEPINGLLNVDPEGAKFMNAFVYGASIHPTAKHWFNIV